MLSRFIIGVVVMIPLSIFAFEREPIEMPVYLGLHAKQYEIKEGSMFAQIQRASEDVNQTELLNKLQEAKRDSMKVDIGLPSCKETKEWIVDLTIEAPEDVVVDGKVIVKKGDRINPTKDTPLIQNIIVLNLNDICEKKLWKNIGKNMLTMVAKGNLADYEDFEVQQIGKANKLFLEKMNISCTPSVVKQFGEYIKVVQYEKESFAQELKCGF